MENDKLTEIDVKIIKNTKEDFERLASYITKNDLKKMSYKDEISNIFAGAEYRKRDFAFGGEFLKFKQEIEKNQDKEKETNKKISELLLKMGWNKEQNIYKN